MRGFIGNRIPYQQESHTAEHRRFRGACPRRASVPYSAIASFAALAAIAGPPAGIMGMYVSVNIPVDAGATCCNVPGDIACAVAVKRTCVLPKKEA